MNEQIILEESKVLEYNEKAYQDTLQLLERVKPFNPEEEKQRIKSLGGDYEEALKRLHMYKGKTYWLEITVQDSYMSSLIYAWMFNKSNNNSSQGSGLHAFGCSLDAIHYQKPSGFTEEQKDLIRKLYEAAF